MIMQASAADLRQDPQFSAEEFVALLKQNAFEGILTETLEKMSREQLEQIGSLLLAKQKKQKQ
jgi:hypothetical protein